MTARAETRVEYILATRAGRVAELLAVAAVGVAGVVAAKAWGSDNLVAGQAILWLANVLMLCLVWAGLRLRGQSWDYIGLRFGRPAVSAALRAAGFAVLVLVAALAAFVLGGTVMSGMVEGAAAADTSGYDYLRGNLPMLLLTLTGVYIVSSFGEEVIYRGFLMTRLTELSPDGRAGTIVALFGSALVFGIAHYAWGPVGVVQTSFMGLVFGGGYLLLRRNLWILVLAHALMDSLLIVPLYSAP